MWLWMLLWFFYEIVYLLVLISELLKDEVWLFIYFDDTVLIASFGNVLNIKIKIWIEYTINYYIIFIKLSSLS